MLCRGWTSHESLDDIEDANVAAAVMSCASLVTISVLLDVLPDGFLLYICRGSVHDHPFLFLPTIHYGVPLHVYAYIYAFQLWFSRKGLSAMSWMYLQSLVWHFAFRR